MLTNLNSLMTLSMANLVLYTMFSDSQARYYREKARYGMAFFQHFNYKALIGCVISSVDHEKASAISFLYFQGSNICA